MLGRLNKIYNLPGAPKLQSFVKIGIQGTKGITQRKLVVDAVLINFNGKRSHQIFRNLTLCWDNPFWVDFDCNKSVIFAQMVATWDKIVQINHLTFFL